MIGFSTSIDGVICDSLDECLVSAYNARHRLRGKQTLVRTALRSADPAAWTALHRHYVQATEGWNELGETHEVHLVTTKDLASVRHFNGEWDLGLDDDHPGHLADVAVTGARCLWAQWGYTAHAPEWPALENLASIMIREGTPA